MVKKRGLRLRLCLLNVKHKFNIDDCALRVFVYSTWLHNVCTFVRGEYRKVNFLSFLLLKFNKVESENICLIGIGNACKPAEQNCKNFFFISTWARVIIEPCMKLYHAWILISTIVHISRSDWRGDRSHVYPTTIEEKAKCLLVKLLVINSIKKIRIKKSNRLPRVFSWLSIPHFNGI